MRKDLFIIIDGSSMLTTAYYGTLPMDVKLAKTEDEKKAAYGKIMQSSGGIYTNGAFSMCRTLLNIRDNLNPKYMAVVFDKSRDTFRRRLYPEYKAQRDTKPTPLKEQFVLMNALLRESGIGVLVDEDYEADDLAGTLVEKYKDRTSIRLMTKDHDYLQLVDDEHDVACWMQEPKAKMETFRETYGQIQDVPDHILDGILRDWVEYRGECVTGEFGVQPEQIPDLKGIQGDTSDNIPGVKGVSSAAPALLSVYGTVEGIYDRIDQCENAADEKTMVAEWKEAGVKRSPLKALKEYRDLGLLSKDLATIRRDVQIPNDSLERYSTSRFHTREWNNWMQRLDIRTLRAA